MKIKSIFAGGILALAVTGGSVATAGTASAHPIPVPKATGSIAMSGPASNPAAGPLQYMSFSAFTGRYHGSVDYANFNYAAANTNVWNISGAHKLSFAFPFARQSGTLNVTAITPTSTHSTKFSGTFKSGFRTYPVSGTVSWNAVSFTISYPHGYKVTVSGSIKANGSVAGTTRDSHGLKMRFAISAGSAFQVLRYTAPLTSASFSGHTVTFWYTIPKSAPAALAGTKIVVKAFDGGFGNRSDTCAFAVAGGSLTQYQITSGNIFVRH